MSGICSMTSFVIFRKFSNIDSSLSLSYPSASITYLKCLHHIPCVFCPFLYISHLLSITLCGLVAKSWPTLMTSTISPPGSSVLCPWNFPGKNTGVGYHFLLQGTFTTQESNLGLHCRQILYRLSHQESPNSLTFFNLFMQLKISGFIYLL